MSFEVVCNIDRSTNETYSRTEFVLAEGLVYDEAKRLAENLNSGYKRYYSQDSEGQVERYTSDFVSNTQKLKEVRIRREYVSSENPNAPLKLAEERKRIVEKLEKLISGEGHELFGLLESTLHFYKTHLGGSLKYHGC